MAIKNASAPSSAKLFEDLVARAQRQEPCRIGLAGLRRGTFRCEFLAAASAMSADPALTVVIGVGPKPSGILPQGMDWIETGCEGPELASGMETRWPRRIHGAVALHHPSPSA